HHPSLGWRSIGWRSTPVHRVLFTSLPRSTAARRFEGSNPGGVPERPKGADCKSAGSAFPGSNPGAATRPKGSVTSSNADHRPFRGSLDLQCRFERYFPVCLTLIRVL